MKTKKLFIIVSIVAVVLALILISLRAYYVAVALLAGTLIIGHRELWYLLRGKKMPVLDERIRENISKALRNGFIFFAVASAFLMLFFSLNQSANPQIVHVLGGLFVFAGSVYLLSYIFYDRAEPKLDEKWSRLLRIFLLSAGISPGVFIISFILHNAVYGLFIHFFGSDFWDNNSCIRGLILVV